MTQLKVEVLTGAVAVRALEQAGYFDSPGFLPKEAITHVMLENGAITSAWDAPRGLALHPDLEWKPEPIERRLGRNRTPRLIEKPPGVAALSKLELVFGTKAVAECFSEVVHDMCAEYVEELHRGRKWHAEMARFRGYLALAREVLLHVWDRLGVGRAYAILRAAAASPPEKKPGDDSGLR